MVNKWGMFFLLLMTLPIMGHVVILPLMLDVAGRDGWMSILIAVPFGILFAWAIYRLRLNCAASDFMTAFQAQAGGWLAYPLRILLIVYLLFLSAFSLACITDMVHIAFLPDSPIWVLVAWFMLFCFYAVLKGVRSISLIGTMLGIIGMITGHSVTAMATPRKDIANMLPMLEFGVTGPLIGILVICSIWIELLFLLVIRIENVGEKRLFLLWTVGVLLNALMMLSTLTGSVMIFGFGQADEFTFPALETVRIIHLGFIDRFDIYGMMLMSFGCYIRTSLYLRLAFQLMLPAQQESATAGGKVLLWLLGIGVAISAYLLAKEHDTMVRTSIFYSWFVFLYPLPFVLLLYTKWKQKRRRFD